MKTCPTCQMMISDNKTKAGLLQPLEISSRKWDHITMDVVTDLPGPNGFMTIVVFVGKLIKIVHLTRCKKEVTTMEYAQIFVDNVFVYMASQRSLYLTKIHVLLASCGVLYSTCSARISSSVLHFIHRQMVNQSG